MDYAADLLKSTFAIWTAVRLLIIPPSLVSGDLIGAAETDNRHQRGDVEYTPVPPVVGAQMRIALIQYVQESLRPRLIRKLREMTGQNRKDTWLARYLSTFILLHSTTICLYSEVRAWVHGTLAEPAHSTLMCVQCYRSDLSECLCGEWRASEPTCQVSRGQLISYSRRKHAPGTLSL